jgi:anti-sigma factor RsiW
MNTDLPPELRDLHAYVDAQLPVAEQGKVETYLQRDPEARQRVSDYRTLRKALVKLYGPTMNEPVPCRLLSPTCRHRWRNGARSLRTLAAGILLALGSAWTGWQWHGTAASATASGSHLVREAAIAYAVYTPEVRHPVEVSAEQQEHLVAWLTKRLAAPVTAPSLAGLGFSLLGGRLLATEDGPGALLMYENPGGQRIVLYLCPNDLGGRSTSFRFGHREGVSVLYWFDRMFSFAVAAELDRNQMLGIAEQVYRAFEA